MIVIPNMTTTESRQIIRSQYEKGLAAADRVRPRSHQNKGHEADPAEEHCTAQADDENLEAATGGKTGSPVNSQRQGNTGYQPYGGDDLLHYGIPAQYNALYCEKTKKQGAAFEIQVVHRKTMIREYVKLGAGIRE